MISMVVFTNTCFVPQGGFAHSSEDSSSDDGYAAGSSGFSSWALYKTYQWKLKTLCIRSYAEDFLVFRSFCLDRFFRLRNPFNQLCVTVFVSVGGNFRICFIRSIVHFLETFSPSARISMISLYKIFSASAYFPLLAINSGSKSLFVFSFLCLLWRYESSFFCHLRKVRTGMPFDWRYWFLERERIYRRLRNNAMQGKRCVCHHHHWYHFKNLS